MVNELLRLLTKPNWQTLNGLKIKHKSLIMDRHNKTYAVEFWLEDYPDLLVKLNEWQIVSFKPSKLIIKTMSNLPSQSATFEI